ncbi:LysR family transcriptional regulator [Dyella nitratireducens]|uniref:LysR family transcriptional regulator n=1 Tax=Dyella nitratireducens TaxID=1849580 RepID=A0ABQ1G8R4_9GAMM|nr:LysR family transcriptional regulator [Dyella nitratireducens]GGA38952.1 LysR family transcriptional regulator [Dyella nitratireducens]GLQ40382.1 LysR family transcriptional regulator [Dyella nitratireducens]
MNTSSNDSIDLLKALKMFTLVYELGNFSAAARLLSITPGAVSKQIGALEDVLGCRLFQRTTRQLSITEEGQRLYALIQQPAQQIEDAIATLSSDEGRPKGTVKVSLPIAFSRTVLLPSLVRFRERFPDITLDLHFENRHVDLISEGFDCAIGQRHETESSVIARHLAPLTLILCASPAYLRRHGKVSSIEGMEDHQLIVFRSPTTGRIETWKLHEQGKEHVIQPRSRLIVTDTEAQAELAATGCGITLIGAHHAYPLIASGKLKQVLPHLSARRSDICIYYPARKNLPRRVSTFVEFVISEARKNDVVRHVEGLTPNP